MVDIFSYSKDIQITNKFKLIYHRLAFNLLAVSLMLLGITLLCAFVYDCYKNSGFVNIVLSKVVSSTPTKDGNYNIEVVFDVVTDPTITTKKQEIKTSFVYSKPYMPGELLELEVADKDIYGNKEVLPWNFLSTLRYNALPFIGGGLIVVALCMMYLLLHEFKIMITLLESTVVYGHYKGTNINGKKKPVTTFMNSAHKTISLFDSKANPIYKKLSPNQEVTIAYYKGYFLITPINPKSK